MRALKAIVIGMGAMIVAAIVLIAYGLYKKSVDPSWRLFGPKTQATETAPPSAPALPFGDIRLDIPSGCRIIDVRPDGRRAYVLIGPDAPCSAVIVVDTATGQVLGRIAGP